MLKQEEYIADWPDLPHPNFIDFLNDKDVRFPNKPAIYYRPSEQKDFTIWTYKMYVAECRRIARGLLKTGLSKGDCVALWSENRPEWMAVWMGAAIAGCTIVPIDAIVSDEEFHNILRLTEAKALFYSERKAAFIKAGMSEFKAKGITLVQIAGEAPGNASYAKFGLDAEDQKLPDVSEIAEQDPVSIVFTSGTTGLSKGVTLSHKGIIANASAATRQLHIAEDDIFISVLPLHHTYPTTCSFITPFSMGLATIIVERLVGEVVIKDIHDAHGTVLIAVPLLYDKIMAGIIAKYKKFPFLVRFVLDQMRKKALAEAKKGNFLWGRKAFLFFRKKAGLESITIMVAGGGALSPATADFFDSLGFNLVHGYGMSENGPLIAANNSWHKNNVSVGLPVKYTEVKIVDQDDETEALGFLKHGEIVVKSPSLMLGYYKNPETTAEMFTSDGYLKTGDLGFMDEDGYIYINGRKKNLIVSSSGKNIYPEEIEMHFEGSRIIAEILVLGRKEPKGESIFAIVVPNMGSLKEDYPNKKIDDAFIIDLVKKEIDKVNRNLAIYKRVQDFMLRNEPFDKNSQQKICRYKYKDYADPAKTPQ